MSKKIIKYRFYLFWIKLQKKKKINGFKNDISLTENFIFHNFAVDALTKLNPYNTLTNIYPNTKEPNKLKSNQQKIDYFVPPSIKPILSSLYKKT